jgi:hypothetical protein
MSNFAKQQIWDGTNTAQVSAQREVLVDPQLEILNEILAQLIILNMNLASCVPSAYVDQDAIGSDAMPSSGF